MIENHNITIDQDIVDFINECKQKEHSRSYVISVLHKVQERYGYLKEKHMDEVAHLLEIPTSTVFGIATFYHFFKLKPKGKFHIAVCLGTACYVKGANSVLESFQTELGIEIGETTQDGMFSIEGTRCLGVCALAPVVTINERVYSKVQPNQVSEILNGLKTQVRR